MLPGLSDRLICVWPGSGLRLGGLWREEGSGPMRGWPSWARRWAPRRRVHGERRWIRQFCRPSPARPDSDRAAHARASHNVASRAQSGQSGQTHRASVPERLPDSHIPTCALASSGALTPRSGVARGGDAGPGVFSGTGRVCWNGSWAGTTTLGRWHDRASLHAYQTSNRYSTESHGKPGLLGSQLSPSTMLHALRSEPRVTPAAAADSSLPPP